MATETGVEPVMELINQLPQSAMKQVVVVGTFDGLHPGHLQILRSALDRGRRLSLPVAVLTFEPDPETFLNDTPPTKRRLLTREDKINILDRFGLDRVYEVPFDASFASISPEEFVSRVLLRQLHAQWVCVGFNFRFGHKRRGDTRLLQSQLEDEGVRVSILPPVKQNQEPISSTRIRNRIRAGEVERARRLLGRPYTVFETIQEGEGRGKKIGFPTLNFPIQRTIHPRVGVYMVWLGTRPRKPAVANFGYHPTVGASDEAVLEVHDLGDPPPLEPGDRTHVYFGRFLRPENHFDSVDELKQQIQKDIETAGNEFPDLERPQPLHEIPFRSRTGAASDGTRHDDGEIT